MSARVSEHNLVRLLPRLIKSWRAYNVFVTSMVGIHLTRGVLHENTFSSCLRTHKPLLPEVKELGRFDSKPPSFAVSVVAYGTSLRGERTSNFELYTSVLFARGGIMFQMKCHVIWFGARASRPNCDVITLTRRSILEACLHHKLTLSVPPAMLQLKLPAILRTAHLISVCNTISDVSEISDERRFWCEESRRRRTFN